MGRMKDELDMEVYIYLYTIYNLLNEKDEG